MSVLRKTYLWDPLEPAATRILAMSLFDETGTWAENLYYTHDLYIGLSEIIRQYI